MRSLLALLLGAALLLAGILLGERLHRPTPETNLSTTLVVQELKGRRTLIVAQAIVEARIRLKVPPSQLLGLRLPDDAELLRLVPATISYGVDLAGLTPESLRWSGQGKVLAISVPDVRIIAVDQHDHDIFETKSLGLLRSEAGLGNALEVEARTITRPALLRRAGDDRLLSFAREQARLSLASLVRTLSGRSDVRVEVLFQPGSKTRQAG
jgi:hypothetical protein